MSVKRDRMRTDTEAGMNIREAVQDVRRGGRVGLQGPVRNPQHEPLTLYSDADVERAIAAAAAEEDDEAERCCRWISSGRWEGWPA